MEPVGFCGIIKLTTHIIHRNLKHFLCIAFILALFYAFLLAFTPSSTNRAQALALLYTYVSQGKIAPTPTQPQPQPQPQPQRHPFSHLIAILLVSIFFGVLSQPLLTFSVCRAVLNKTLSFRSSLLAVPRSALNLIITVLCITGFVTAMVFLMMIITVGLVVIDINIPAIVLVICIVVVVGGGLYFMGIACSLATTVAILEEMRGWEAMARSMYLVDGSKWVVFSLYVVFSGCMMFLPINASEDASAIWRWSCVVLSLGLQAMIALFSMASTVVLYLSCKSRFKEPLDTLIALSAQFGPPETSAKYMDLESASFDTT